LVQGRIGGCAIATIAFGGSIVAKIFMVSAYKGKPLKSIEEMYKSVKKCKKPIPYTPSRISLPRLQHRQMPHGYRH
jgi:hypothetical protein